MRKKWGLIHKYARTLRYFAYLIIDPYFDYPIAPWSAIKEIDDGGFISQPYLYLNHSLQRYGNTKSIRDSKEQISEALTLTR